MSKKIQGEKAQPAKDLARLVAQAAYDSKAENLTILDLRQYSNFTDFFVIASGRSDRQVQGIADNIEEALKEAGIRPLSKEGYEQGHWILIDFGSVVAHVFYEETRGFYGLEKFWGDAPRVRFRLK